MKITKLKPPYTLIYAYYDKHYIPYMENFIYVLFLWFICVTVCTSVHVFKEVLDYSGVVILYSVFSREGNVPNIIINVSDASLM